MPEDKFCPTCAAALESKDVASRQRPVCPKCGRVVYYGPKIAATCIVEREGKVLMIRRGNEPEYGLWGMPGGYVDRGEVVEAAAAREVKEETGLEMEIDHLVGLFSEPGQPVMVAAYAARPVGGCLKAGEEVLDLGFSPPNDLPDLAFPRDRQILDRWQALPHAGLERKG